MWSDASPIIAKKPSQTRRAKIFKEHRAKTRSVQRVEEKITTLRTEILTIWLRTPAQVSYPISVGYFFGPQDYVPMTDEAPWPDLPSVDALQELAEAMRADSRSVDTALKDFLDESMEDGLFDQDANTLSADPWLGVLSMYANYAKEVIETPIFSSSDIESFSTTLEFTQQLIEQHPTSSVADYARLLELEILKQTHGHEKDEFNVEEYIVNILYESKDPMVIKAALGAIPTTPDASPKIGTWLDNHLHTLDGDINEVMAINRINQAANAGDPEAAQRWLDLYRNTLDERCTEMDCSNEYYALNTYMGHMGNLWDTAPTSWRDAIVQAAYSCNISPSETPILEGLLEWSGKEWTASPELAHCMHQLSNDLGPLGPIQVQVFIHPAPTVKTEESPKQP
jgi:hypothetical protein